MQYYRHVLDKPGNFCLSVLQNTSVLTVWVGGGCWVLGWGGGGWGWGGGGGGGGGGVSLTPEPLGRQFDALVVFYMESLKH